MKIVCVTGMHRSGTSLAAGVLEVLGVDFGSRQSLLQPGEENPAGFWEQGPIVELNDVVLSALGGSWYLPPPLEDGWQRSRRLDGLRAEADAVLAEIFPDRADNAWGGWKDPRFSLLLPFWRVVVPVERTILVVRDPRDVADSLAVRNGIDAEHAAYLWLRYVVSAWRADPNRLVLSYSRFFEDLESTVAALSRHLTATPTAQDMDAVRGLVAPNLRRAKGNGSPGSGIMRRALTLWDAMRLSPVEADLIVEREQHRLLRRERGRHFTSRLTNRARTVLPVRAKTVVRRTVQRLGVHDRRRIQE